MFAEFTFYYFYLLAEKHFDITFFFPKAKLFSSAGQSQPVAELLRDSPALTHCSIFLAVYI